MEFNFYTFIILILFFFNNVQGQIIKKELPDQYQLPNTEQHILISRRNNIHYKLYISLPESYADSLNKDYPVLYLLDADYSFAIAKNIVDHLSQRNHLKEIIVVGIAYAGEKKYRLHRTRDYTPTRSIENVPFSLIQANYSGGGPGFLKFIEYELIPFMDRKWRTDGFKVLSGHSYGGLFSSWILLSKPALFDGYIIVSPSLWYDNKLVLRMKDKLEDTKKPLRVFFMVGDREWNSQWNMPKDLELLVQKINSKKMDNITIEHQVGENETHNSIFPTALGKGIRFIFDGL